MLIFDENTTPLLLDSIHSPTLAEHYWVLDLSLMDYKLAELVSLEETICPSLRLRVNGFEFTVPANWNVLVYDRDTSQLDALELAEACGREFTALVYGPRKFQHSAGLITVVDYYVDHKNVGPLLSKQQMLCHPIGPEEWINIAPSDGYNKYLKDKTVGDLLVG